ncbi:unnamed protein product, partial [Mesorhabditis belari]|uniref:Uncharacterized protein n=1 Tax=Mesorhabditis belari TaxID=2138241 RepID=A0AAF3EKM8_9BILA
MFVAGSSSFTGSPKMEPENRFMHGKNVLITGSTSGIGLHAAKHFYSLGASVIITYREAERGKKAVETVVESAVAMEGQSVMMLELDLCSFISVDNFCTEVKNALKSLDVLVCNAGVMGRPFELTTNGVESHFAANQLGHFILVRQLIELIEKAENGRIIVVSSGYYKQATVMRTRKELMGESIWDYTPTIAYANSKLANCLFVRDLERRLTERGSPVKVFCVRPGFIKGTDLGRETSWFLRTIATPVIWAFASNLDQGISGIVHCATSDFDELISGKLYYQDQMEECTDTVTAENGLRLWRMCERMETLIAERSHGKIATPRVIQWPKFDDRNVKNES